MNIDLVDYIELVRDQMIFAGMSSGFTSEETVRLSKKLDTLLNLQMKILSN
ncbi:aspartyl-phosphate phosphatase Spo0E family protein [Neobacillus niacini]|uniref:aspartyl-phosphate phosphatase Spo0E family protein n=1 Tax=Neobacillus niacini TaxID=86668 RepID=UPI0028BE9A5B|nr:aspartyl-phosphate phosphatase Spo0E family protein [Neobacillus niacini]